MRAFIAIDLPKQLKDSLSSLQQKLKAAGADVKWVAPSNIHLTLKFLGEIDDKTKDLICVLLTEIASHTAPFAVRIGGVGAFPNTRLPRIIWIGLSQGHDQTMTIVDELENNLEKYGISKEARPFSSHITIGRVRSQKHKEDLVRSISGLNASVTDNIGEFQAGKITLFKSTLLPQGPLYEILQETNLKTA